MEAVNTAAQLLIILVDIPHCRADAAAAGAVAALATLLKPVAEDAVSATEEVPSITCSATCPCEHWRAHRDMFESLASRNYVHIELDPVWPVRQVAAILMSKLVLEPETHSGISRAGAIPSLVRSCNAGFNYPIDVTMHCRGVTYQRLCCVLSHLAGSSC